MTNKVISSSELQMIENYIKNTNYINTNGVKVPRLPQSKSCLKIIGIPYLQENINISITSSVVEDFIKKNHIFNNIILVFKPHIIKVSPRLDMAIIWVDIWNVQSSSNVRIAEGGLNFYFSFSFLFYFLFHFRSIFYF